MPTFTNVAGTDYYYVWPDSQDSGAATSSWVSPWDSTTNADTTSSGCGPWNGWVTVYSHRWTIRQDAAWTEWVAIEQENAEAIVPAVPQHVMRVYDRSEAHKKAEELLTRHLTEEQKAQLARDNFFIVKGSKDTLYRIERGRSRNVAVLDAKGNAVARLCAHPHNNVPDADTMLAQKLMLETDQGEFERIANRSAA